MRPITRLYAVLGVAALIMALSVSVAQAQVSTDEYPPSTTAGGSTGAETEVEGETITNPAQTDEGETDDDLAFTGRTVGSVAGVAVLAMVAGGVLVMLARRREGVTS